MTGGQTFQIDDIPTSALSVLKYGDTVALADRTSTHMPVSDVIFRQYTVDVWGNGGSYAHAT